MKMLAFAVLSLVSLNSFAALRADCVGRLEGKDIDLQVLARGTKMQLKSSALRYGNLTSLTFSKQENDSSFYVGKSNCNSFSGGGVTELMCRRQDEITVVIANEIADIASADSLPLGESFSLKLQRKGLPALVMSCETTILLSRNL